MKVFYELVEKLRAKNLTLGTVESITGGLFAGEITRIPGSSSVFKGGIITYTSDIKIKLLKVSIETINKYGVVSSQVADEMASRGQELLDTDVIVSFTGNAGPTALGNEPIGSVYVGVKCKYKTNVYHLKLSGSRQEIRESAVNFAALRVLEFLNN